ncbi:N-acetylmuramic acid 6-phosphate phosphatase [uncultured Comamonas sp.]|nr:N-acetylmuramic acid 6-phosphate phosphatase [uncultured Comamonas sp.]
MSQLSSGITTVLFDLDGTLLDSAPDLAAAANFLRTQRGLRSLPLAHYRPFVGTGARGMLRLALGVGETQPDFELLKEEFFRAYEACMGQYSAVFPQIPALLQALGQKNCSWGIVTNKIKRFANPIVRTCPVLSGAQALVCGDSTAYTKPHPAPLLAAAQQLGVAPEHCVYVGDDERDIQAARAAGMGAIAASYGYVGETEDVRHWQPDAVICFPQELIKVLALE